MKNTLDKKRPICPQLCEQICVNIACGRYKEGERMPSVREMALEAGVNPNTVQHALWTSFMIMAWSEKKREPSPEKY